MVQHHILDRRQVRLITLGLVICGVSVAVTLALFGLRDTITFFYSPSDIIGDNPEYVLPDRPFRLGGLVAQGSVVQRDGKLYFSVTDNTQEIRVVYERFPPDLFREGQGVVATGVLKKMDDDILFYADELLAKHDENYMPPEVSRALEKTKTNQK